MAQKKTPAPYQWWSNLPFAAMVASILFGVLNKAAVWGIPVSYPLILAGVAFTLWVGHYVLLDVEQHRLPSAAQIEGALGRLETLAGKVEAAKPSAATQDIVGAVATVMQATKEMAASKAAAPATAPAATGAASATPAATASAATEASATPKG